MGPNYRSKRVQDPIQVSSSPIGCSDKSDSIFLPVIARRDRRTSQETGVERVRNPGTPGFYSRILLVPASTSAEKRGKLRPVIDLSLLNQCINKQHFKMETVKSVRQSIIANNWAVSIDLTDAYRHVHNTSEIQKIPSVHLRTSGLSAHGLTVRNIPKSVDFHKINECISSTLTTSCRISLPIPRQLTHKRSDSQSTYLSHKIHSPNGTKFGFQTKSKDVRFDTNTTIHLNRYGITQQK